MTYWIQIKIDGKMKDIYVLIDRKGNHGIQPIWDSTHGIQPHRIQPTRDSTPRDSTQRDPTHTGFNPHGIQPNGIQPNGIQPTQNSTQTRFNPLGIQPTRDSTHTGFNPYGIQPQIVWWTKKIFFLHFHGLSPWGVGGDV